MMLDMELLTQNSRIHVAGHTGFVGSAVVRRLSAEGFESAYRWFLDHGAR